MKQKRSNNNTVEIEFEIDEQNAFIIDDDLEFSSDDDPVIDVDVINNKNGSESAKYTSFNSDGTAPSLTTASPILSNNNSNNTNISRRVEKNGENSDPSSDETSRNETPDDIERAKTI